MRTAGLCAALIPLLGPAAALGEDGEGPDFARPGWYLGMGATLAHPSADTLPPPPTLSGMVVETSLGVNARLGYRLHPHAAVEVELEYVTNFEQKATYLRNAVACDPDDNTGSPSNPPVFGACAPENLVNLPKTVNGEVQRSTDLALLTVNGKVPLLTGRFQPFVIGGLGVYYSDTEKQPARRTASADSVRAALAAGKSVRDAEKVLEHGHVSNLGTLSQNDFGFAARAGGGFDLYFTEEFLFSFDTTWVYANGFNSLPVSDPYFVNVSMGFQFRFK